MKIKKLLTFILVICLGFCFVGCGKSVDPSGGEEPAPPEQPKPTLMAPANLRIDDLGTSGLVSWTMVVNATSYKVTVNGTEHTTLNRYYSIAPLTVDYVVSVVACADGYIDSVPSTVRFDRHRLSVGIEGKSEMRSAGELQLSAVVKDSEADDSVRWQIIEGKDYAAIDSNGKLTAHNVTGDKMVVVKATSVEDPEIYATKAITITARPELTQAMLDKLADDSISFEGYLDIDLKKYGKLQASYTYDVYTAMNGTNWFARYTNAAGGTAGLYYINDGGLASQVVVTFRNDEQYVPLLDEDNQTTTWNDAGLYNGFKYTDGCDASASVISVSDFTFNEESWRWEYTGSNTAFVERLMSAATPYEFKKVETLALMVDAGDVVGLYAVAAPDSFLVEGNDAYQTLTVAINTGDKADGGVVEVPTITHYTLDENIHAPLVEAINNMHSLSSYTTEVLNVGASIISSSYTFNGYLETVTEDVCHFRSYTFVPAPDGSFGIGNGQRNFDGDEYGYVRRRNDLYNAFVKEDEGYRASRAYMPVPDVGEDVFDYAKPTFAFDAAIFTARAYNEDDETYTYYVDLPMSAVASTFYFGVGNEIQLYGLFATEGYTSATSSFTPYVEVKKADDGHGEQKYFIVGAGYYYSVSYLYGVMEIAYSGFDSTETDPDVKTKLDNTAVRELPTDWTQVQIIDDSEDESGVEVEALGFLKDFFSDDDIGNKLPFFGDALGDTYGIGFTTQRIVSVNGTGVSKTVIALYYDVPLELDYTLTSYIDAVEDLLTDNGFTRKDNYFVKDGIAVQPADKDLDLIVYVWRA